MKIREMGEADRLKWLDLRRALWPECSEERHEIEVAQWENSDGVVLLAEGSDGRALGFAEVSIRREHVEGTSSAPVAYLEAWYVVPEERRKGIGRALIESAVRWSSEAGFSELACDAEFDNSNAIQAHKDLGFREVGRSIHFVRTLPKSVAKSEDALHRHDRK
jgi:aminoglycoside 6'-N-acetyltransferase I